MRKVSALDPSIRPPCFHCGQVISEGETLFVEIGGRRRDMCCRGCQSVAQTITDNGLENYYLNRAALPETPAQATTEALEQLGLLDHPELQRSFISTRGESEREVSLLLEGITCSACTWLIEQHVSRISGVTAVAINYATRRLRVRWNETSTRLSSILAAITAIGYQAHPYNAAKHDDISRRERKDAILRLWVAGFGMMQVMMYAVPVYMADYDEIPADIESLMRWGSLLLTFPVVVYSAAPFFKNAWRDLKLGRAGMDVPVALGVGASFAASVWATLIQSGEVYFDTVTMFVFFLLGGRYLEMAARRKMVSASESLARLLPAFALRMPGYPSERKTEQVLVADLRPGDSVLVRAGDTIPADGLVVAGTSSASEALITGESRPVVKAPGNRVIGGSINAESQLIVQVEAVGENTHLSAIVRLMEQATASKPRLAEIADQIASHFILCLLVVALTVALVWYWIDPSQALWVTISVLVVTCPCALSLATPVALTVAISTLARHGLLVTGGHAIETLARATHFVFDKTGTLTKGNMRLLEVLPLKDISMERCLALAAALEQNSEHPIATAFRSEAEGLQLPAIQDPRNFPGQGVEAIIDGRTYRIGRPDFVLASGKFQIPLQTENWLADGNTVVGLGDETGALALFRIGDEVRLEAESLVQTLKAMGKEVMLLTGDGQAAADRVARQLGIENVRAGCTPQDKHDIVAGLQFGGAIVAMVGDGLNDAPVLAQAHVSVALGGGAQLACSKADVILLSENLSNLKLCLVHTGSTVRIIKQNLLWSFAYNFFALPLAIGGYITPWMASIGMSASSILVVLNSLRLQRQDKHSAPAGFRKSPSAS